MCTYCKINFIDLTVCFPFKLNLIVYNSLSVYFVLSSSFSGKAKSVQAIFTNVSTRRYWYWFHSRLSRRSMFSLISHAQSHLNMLLLVRPQLSQVQRHQFKCEKKGRTEQSNILKRTDTKIKWSWCQSLSPFSHRFLWQELREKPRFSISLDENRDLVDMNWKTFRRSTSIIYFFVAFFAVAGIHATVPGIFYILVKFSSRLLGSKFTAWHIFQLDTNWIQLRGGKPMAGMAWAPMGFAGDALQLRNFWRSYPVFSLKLTGWNLKFSEDFQVGNFLLFWGGSIFKFHVSFRRVFGVWKDLDTTNEISKVGLKPKCGWNEMWMWHRQELLVFPVFPIDVEKKNIKRTAYMKIHVWCWWKKSG